MYLVRALAEAYMRNITSAAVRTLIHDFLGVQVDFALVVPWFSSRR
jgi:hypothetical protein